MPITIELDVNPNAEDLRTLVNRLIEFNDARAQEENWHPLAVFVRGEDHEIMGGLNGFTHWGWLFIEHLWIADRVRGMGLGRSLLLRAEAEAVTRRCHSAHVDTFDFQALSFYERMGYSVFGVLRNYPTGHSRFFSEKRLLAATV